MEKQITITLSERKARNLADSLLAIIKQMDELYEKNKIERTKQSANELEEIRNDVVRQIFAE